MVMGGWWGLIICFSLDLTLRDLALRHWTGTWIQACQYSLGKKTKNILNNPINKQTANGITNNNKI